jgi:glutathione peroxidase
MKQFRLRFMIVGLTILMAGVSVMASDFYSIQINDFRKKTMDLAKLKGKTVLVVNIATRCGYTGQLDDLEKLYKKHEKKDFVIVGVPSNDFGGQTPESEEEVEKFCRLNYGVSFPLTEKLKVKGSDKHSLYAYLLSQKDGEVAWNFEKFLISKDGKVVGRFKSSVEPLGEELDREIRKVL